VKSAASVAQDGGQVEETCYTPKNYAGPMFFNLCNDNFATVSKKPHGLRI
jgi:hypothetical protein